MDLKDYFSGSYYSLELLQDKNKGPLSKDQNEKLREEKEKTFSFVKDLFEKESLETLKIKNEDALTKDWIDPIINKLGWITAIEQTFSFHSKPYRPDLTLFKDFPFKSQFEKEIRVTNTPQDCFKSAEALICECKKWSVELDNNSLERESTSKNKDEDKANPHFQILTYLTASKTTWGFLTNGRLWRLYDASLDSNSKIYYEVDLLKIIQENDIEAFGLFYYVFNKKDDFSQFLETLKEEEKKVKLTLEESLKDLLYGEDSLIESIGRALYQKSLNQSSFQSLTKEKIDDIFHDSLIFAFRLIFMAYYESRYEKTLKNHAEGYHYYSLYEFYKSYLKNQERYKETRTNLLEELIELWEKLDTGSLAKNIPMLNGGLFSPKKAPLLQEGGWLDNHTLSGILTSMLVHPKSPKGSLDSLIYREFESLSVSQLGSIYEGFLEYEFRRAEENLYLIDSLREGAGYYNEEDFKRLKLEKESHTFFPKGSLYLSSLSNNRKTSASYYTPQEFTSFQAREAIKTQLEAGKKLQDLKIIDNACGSGHYLVTTLSVLADEALKQLEENSELENLIREEKKSIQENLKGLKIGKDQFDHFIDEFQVLKRVLVKRCFFGVDLSEIAVELTRLSLWIETFVFGTPLSFLEHHIKQGNSLIGLSEEELISFSKLYEEQRTLFTENPWEERLAKLKEAQIKISKLSDTTAEEAEQSKQIWAVEIEPILEPLKRICNFVLYQEFLEKVLTKKPKGEKEPFLILRTVKADLVTNFLTYLPAIESGVYSSLSEKQIAFLKEVNNFSQKYHFFHYFLEFADVEKGQFDIVLGNPPWDKVKFTEVDFFKQYDSRYSLTKSKTERNRIKERLFNEFTYPWIKKRYQEEQFYVKTLNEFLKCKYTLAAGSGDRDLFRYFIALNLKNLTPTGVLSYLTPSAWAMDAGGLQVREYIWENCTLDFFYQFENREGFFKDVHRSYKIAVWQVRPVPMPEDHEIQTRFMATDLQVLESGERIRVYPKALIEKLSPKNKSLFELQSDTDEAFARKLMNRFPTLEPSYIDFIRELDMTNDKPLFNETKPDGEGWLPLYEGKKIWQYNSLFDSFSYWVKSSDLEQKLASAEYKRLIDSLYNQFSLKLDKDNKNKEQAVFKRLGLATGDNDPKEQLQFDYTEPRLAFRAIASGTNERTFVASIIPAYSTAGNSLWLSMRTYSYNEASGKIEKSLSYDRLFLLQGILNSLVMDRFIRFMVSINVNKFYLYFCPLPQPSDEEIACNPDYAQIVKLSQTLTYYHNPEAFPYLKDQIDSRSWGSTEESRNQACDHLRAEIDALVAKIYGISSYEMTYILSNFKVMSKERPEYGGIVLREMEKLGL